MLRVSEATKGHSVQREVRDVGSHGGFLVGVWPLLSPACHAFAPYQRFGFTLPGDGGHAMPPCRHRDRRDRATRIVVRL